MRVAQLLLAVFALTLAGCHPGFVRLFEPSGGVAPPEGPRACADVRPVSLRYKSFYNVVFGTATLQFVPDEEAGGVGAGLEPHRVAVTRATLTSPGVRHVPVGVRIGESQGQIGVTEASFGTPYLLPDDGRVHATFHVVFPDSSGNGLSLTDMERALEGNWAVLELTWREEGADGDLPACSVRAAFEDAD